MVIMMQKLVECKLVICSEINNKKEQSVIEGKGYFKDDDNEIIIYFTSDDIKYKYVYNGVSLIITCNDSIYEFKENEFREGKIKNGEYIFAITTFASKIQLLENKFVLDYTLSQNNCLIGTYNSELSFY